MNEKKHFKTSYIFTSLGYVILGAIFLIHPELSLNVVCYAFGTLTIIYGIVHLITYFVKDRLESAFRYDMVIGIIAVALGIFIATLGGGSFTKYNKYLIGDILSVTPAEIGMLALVLLAVIVFFCIYSNRLALTAIHPQMASSRGIPVGISQTIFTVAIAVVVTLSISSVGLLILNSLLVLPAASSRNVARNLKQYHAFSVLFAFVAGLAGLIISYYWGTSAGAAISLMLALIFAVSFSFRKVRA